MQSEYFNGIADISITICRWNPLLLQTTHECFIYKTTSDWRASPQFQNNIQK